MAISLQRAKDWARARVAARQSPQLSAEQTPVVGKATLETSSESEPVSRTLGYERGRL